MSTDQMATSEPCKRKDEASRKGVPAEKDLAKAKGDQGNTGQPVETANALLPILKQMAKQSFQSREAVLPWDEFAFCLANWGERKHNPPKDSVGACLTTNESVQHRILSVEGSGPCSTGTKLNISSSHAAALLAFRHPELIKDATLYLTKFPCLSCVKILVQTHLHRLVVPIDTKEVNENCEEVSTIDRAIHLLSKSGVQLIFFEKTRLTQKIPCIVKLKDWVSTSGDYTERWMLGLAVLATSRGVSTNDKPPNGAVLAQGTDVLAVGWDGWIMNATPYDQSGDDFIVTAEQNAIALRSSTPSQKPMMLYSTALEKERSIKPFGLEIEQTFLDNVATPSEQADLVGLSNWVKNDRKIESLPWHLRAQKEE